VSPWFQDRGGLGGQYHHERCVAVDRYGFERVDDRDDCPEVDRLITCRLCEQGVTPEIDRYGPIARRLGPELRDDELGFTAHLDPLRTLCSVTEGPLRAEGYLEENTGAEIRTVTDWQERHKEAADRALFEWHLRDCIECHLVFYREYKGFEEDGPFIEAVLDQSGTGADGCAQNVCRTWRWLDGLGIPDSLETRQSTLAEVASSDD
jgi:hypothetical protein